jgi:hypothetical protein
MVMDFITFSIIFVILNIGLDAVSMFIKIPGLDFLFFAPWLASTKFGIYNPLILGLVLLVIHSAFHLGRIFYSVSALPALVVAVLLGSLLGLGGFYISLIAYLAVCSIIVLSMGGFSGRYSLFLFISFLFNSFAFYLMSGLI